MCFNSQTQTQPIELNLYPTQKILYKQLEDISESCVQKASVRDHVAKSPLVVDQVILVHA